jgi:hypothetical protein
MYQKARKCSYLYVCKFQRFGIFTDTQWALRYRRINDAAVETNKYSNYEM